ncbi:hypothetical protein GALMADRAFT_154472 [Galerina marginata CBS 339.88]|uniref:CHAT domain-containing protein n=1 Tax=Galerina marginata (strain CBS 339.88) TaxID=685588 RepID=A0A067TL21_GALM3|nr:hypothetical protein GALMADRAFT_154472 [Galerina marginata CBS 339.88]
MPELDLLFDSRHEADVHSTQEPGDSPTVKVHMSGEERKAIVPTAQEDLRRLVKGGTPDMGTKDSKENVLADYPIKNVGTEETKGLENIDFSYVLMDECKGELSVANLDQAVVRYRQILDNHTTAYTLQTDEMMDLASVVRVRLMYTDQTQNSMEALALRGEILKLYKAILDNNIAGIQDKPDTTAITELANGIITDFQKSTSLHVLNNIVSLVWQSVNHLPSTHPSRCSALITLAEVLRERLQHCYSISNLKHALSTLQARREPDRRHINMPHRICYMLLTRFDFRGGKLDLQTAFHWIKNTNFGRIATIGGLRTGGSTPVHKVDPLTDRGLFHLKQFDRHGQMKDIEEAVRILEDVLRRTPGEHADRPARLNNLGRSYTRRFQRTGNFEDIDRAISNLQKAVQSTPFNHPYLPSLFNNLGTSYVCRHEHAGDPQDNSRAISNFQSAIQFTLSGQSNLSIWMDNLGNSYGRRFLRTGDLRDISLAISAHQNSVKYTPSGDPDLPMGFNSLGNSYMRRFERTGNLQDIDLAIFNHRTAVKCTPSGDYKLPERLNNLGDSYLRRFERTGDLQNIVLAISNHESAVQSTPSGHVGLPHHLSSLGTSYLCRFERTGDLQDIDFAISNHQIAHDTLGTSYLRRFNRTGDLHDIERSIYHYQNAVRPTTFGNAYLPAMFSHLGTSYLCRFEHTGDPEDIEQAVSNHQSAVESTPSDHADFPRLLNSLGNSYALRYEHTGELEDINRAISNHLRVLQLTPPGHANLLMRFNNLGTSYLRRFRHTGNIEDIDSAISNYQSAIQSTPVGHTDLPRSLKNLGKSYSHRFNHTRHPHDLQNSIVSYRRGAEATGSPSDRLHCAKRAAMLSFMMNDDSRCLSDFALAISLLSEVAGLEQTIYRRHTNLQDHSDLVGPAVDAALTYNQPNLALEWLEQGRCLVWNQLNQLRIPLDDLQVTNPVLADRFVKVAGDLESHGARLSSSLPSTFVEDVRLQAKTHNHTVLAAEYGQLLEEIRSLPGFHDFLQPPKTADLLSSMPTDGVVVIINVHKTRCDALALIPGAGEPMHIPLKDFSLAEAEELQKRLQYDLLKLREADTDNRMPRRSSPNPPSMSYILKELWYKVVRPVLKGLGYSVNSGRWEATAIDRIPYPSPTLLVEELLYEIIQPKIEGRAYSADPRVNPSDRRRLWWCPTGPLAFLPLHAAGNYGSIAGDSITQAGRCVSDFVVSSYTPTVRSLIEKFKASSTFSKAPSLVIVSQPNTQGLPPIPYTKTETDSLKKLMDENSIETLLLADSEGTRDEIKAGMQAHTWAHFACHGIQDINQPLESGLYLHDGRLELLEIMKQQI